MCLESLHVLNKTEQQNRKQPLVFGIEWEKVKIKVLNLVSNKNFSRPFRRCNRVADGGEGFEKKRVTVGAPL